jgi:outer membrane biosynthesis protein TonB
MTFHLKSPLFEEQQEQNTGGGDGSTAQPPIDLTKFRTELKTELLGEIRKDLNGIEKKNENFRKSFTSGFDSFKTDLTAMLKPKEEAVSENEEESEEEETPVIPPKGKKVEAAAETPKPPKKSQPSPHEQRLQRELEALRAKQEETEKAAKKREADAEAKEINGSLKEAIAKHQVNSDRGQSDLFAVLRPNLVRGEDGNLYGPEGKTLDEYVSDEYAARPFLHPAKNVNGSGAGPSAGNPSLPSKNFDVDNIRPNMSADDFGSAYQAIAQALGKR